jgi:hypothetical protein
MPNEEMFTHKMELYGGREKKVVASERETVNAWIDRTREWGRKEYSEAYQALMEFDDAQLRQFLNGNLGFLDLSIYDHPERANEVPELIREWGTINPSTPEGVHFTNPNRNKEIMKAIEEIVGV